MAYSHTATSKVSSQCHRLVAVKRLANEGGEGQRENNSWGWNGFHGFSSLNAGSCMLIGITLCDGDKGKNESEKAIAEQFMDQLSPIMSQLTIGTTMGFASGYALRTIGKMAAVLVGCSFMLLQGAAYKGWVHINWNAATKDLHSVLDQDGDGDFDMDDMKILFTRFVEVATYNLPSGTGFTAGLLLGLGFTGGTAGRAAAAVGTATLIPRAIMMGGAATAGSSAMVSFKDQYDAARRSAEQVLGTITLGTVSEEERFKESIKGKTLVELRNMEKEVKQSLKSPSNEEEKKKIETKLKMIEQMKIEVKKS
ncbi:hypothetical protein GUITHDRAFT_163302 [Guillardia theta CCMP2712]|uniref:EF-hand domain-containing protein n=2 Tax=Guillardia theta TaxID=55529 RepID=L1JAC6_GUITC|nr:hypothetical protein GUITHDRAFT_163302 [Guillardia theta CCMP2712]EKX45498.1 hypothetical protein GUITHDRAFT_163302 [Guillardia theta CCMP2712]|eukprot:XP_005832478.1 hypothetical protein GUITHDRAFT_163302 [Guillardia theta CCMP2712]